MDTWITWERVGHRRIHLSQKPHLLPLLDTRVDHSTTTCSNITAKAIRSPNAGLMLARRRRRGANIETALGQRLVWPGDGSMLKFKYLAIYLMCIYIYIARIRQLGISCCRFFNIIYPRAIESITLYISQTRLVHLMYTSIDEYRLQHVKCVLRNC